MRRKALRDAVRRRFSREGAVGLYLTIGFAASVLLVILFAILAREVTGVPGLALDREITLDVRSYQTPGRTRLVRTLTDLGDAAFLIPATLAVCVMLLWKKHRVSALLFAGSVVGGFLLSSILKVAFRRTRPDLWASLVTERTYSFPSGHATQATVFFGGLAAIALHLSRNRAFRAAAVAGAAAIVLAVDFSRVYLGAHWTSDVIWGTIIGLLWVAICVTGTEFFARRPRRAG